MITSTHLADTSFNFFPLDPDGQLSSLLSKATHIPIISHVAPDGDAVGSVLGAYWLLRAMGKQPVPLLMDAFPTTFNYLPASELIRSTLPAGTPDEPVDLILVLDLSSTDRIGQFYTKQRDLFDRVPFVQVDHHSTNTYFADLNLVDSQASSTCELIYRLALELGAPVTPEAALCLLNGLVTDTLCFRTSNTSANTLRIATALIEAGASLNEVTEAYTRSRSISTLRLWGLAFNQLQARDNILWIAVSKEMLTEADANPEESDSIANDLISVQTCDVGIVFKEDFDGTVKASLRSTERVNVAEIARHFGGGGHNRASGFTFNGTLAEAQEAVIPYIAEHYPPPDMQL